MRHTLGLAKRQFRGTIGENPNTGGQAADSIPIGNCGVRLRF
jgi:hypothetical protein